MCDIKDFLRVHPLINLHGLEQQSSVPLSTIKLNSDRPIPGKYIQLLKDTLKGYGLIDKACPKEDIVMIPIGKTYIYRNKGFGNWTKLGIYDHWDPFIMPELTVVTIQ